MTAAETLLRAARVLREAAGKATPGPWVARDMAIYVPDPANERTGVRAGIAGGADPADAAYIALMGPTVGLALADWLLHESDQWGYEDNGGLIRPSEYAVTIARAILGETTAENGPDRAPGEVSGGGQR